jgi:RNA polymerase sigma-70 factor (ECF subfamily)
MESASELSMVFLPTFTASQKEAASVRSLEMELAKRALGGDEKAFTSVVQRYQRPVYNLCLRYVGEADAEDMAQETFIRAFVNKERFIKDKPLLPWLLTIARHRCIDRIRRRKKEVITDMGQANPLDGAPTAEQTLESNQMLAQLWEGLKTLPEGHREVICLYHFDELSYKEIAEIMDTPIGTVMTWLHRGREKLRAGMGEESQEVDDGSSE